MILPLPACISQDEIYAFYKHISKNVTLPVMICYNPGNSGVNILPETLDKIADLPHMGFLKESTGDIMRLTRAVDELADRLVISLRLREPRLRELRHGREGVGLRPRQRRPAQSARLYDLIVNQGKLEEARALYRQILPLLRLTEETGELWQIVKYILKQRGFGTGTLRLPRQPISEGVKAQLDELLGKADFA
ncbi:MAG: dihydrodipicolinate synthase family protein [Bilophila wadsworthia]